MKLFPFVVVWLKVSLTLLHLSPSSILRLARFIPPKITSLALQLHLCVGLLFHQVLCLLQSSTMLVAGFVKGLRLDFFKSWSTYFPSIGPTGNAPLHCIHRRSSRHHRPLVIPTSTHLRVDLTRGDKLARVSVLRPACCRSCWYFCFLFYFIYLCFCLYVIWVLLYPDLCWYIYTIQSLHQTMIVHLQL